MRSEALPTDTVPDEEAASDATRSASGWRGLLGTVVVESGRRQQGDVAFFPPASLPQLVPGGSRRVSLQFSRHGATPESEEALSSSPVLLLRRWMLLHSRSISLPSPLPLRSISKARAQRGLVLWERQGRDLFKPSPHPAEAVLIPPLTPASPAVLFPRLGTTVLTLLPLFFFFSSAGMEASWRQVASGRGRARGRATAAPSSGNGVHLRGAGGGREKGSVGAAGLGPIPGGAATPAAAGSSARRSPAGSEAPQTSLASGENGSRPRAHLDAYLLKHLLVRTAFAPISFLLLREFIIGLTSQTFQAATHSRPIPITPLSSLL